MLTSKSTKSSDSQTMMNNGRQICQYTTGADHLLDVPCLPRIKVKIAPSTLSSAVSSKKLCRCTTSALALADMPND